MTLSINDQNKLDAFWAYCVKTSISTSAILNQRISITPTRTFLTFLHQQLVVTGANIVTTC